MSNACALVRVTSGKHIVMSSGARKLMVCVALYSEAKSNQVINFVISFISQELRGPHDVINLATIFDLSYENARHSVISVPEKAVSHGDIRVNTFKGIVRVVGEVDEYDTIMIDEKN